MKTGIGIFIAAVAGIGLSWCGLVIAPNLQLGSAKLQPVLNSGDTWPVQPTGAETLGAQVYRANGCVACHTLQTRQTGVTHIITLTDLGVHKPADFADYVRSLFVLPELQNYTNALASTFKDWNGGLPKDFLTCDDTALTDAMASRLKAIGVKSETRIIATGPDIAKGWGARRSVAADYLYAAPVQLGSLRAGPDLSNIGLRSAGVTQILQHLYAPKSVTANSTMPPYRFLFELRKKSDGQSAPDALSLPEGIAPAGYDVVPTTDAKNLAAYLLSLKANAPLYEAPFTPVTAAK
jgi:cbb3-type cytochrome oxidase cytochrome c subunit